MSIPHSQAQPRIFYTQPSYATADDVARVLGYGTGYFTAQSTPSVSDVNAIIVNIEEMIDQRLGHAWRIKRVEHTEYYEMGRLGRRYSWFLWQGYPIFLRHRKVQPFDTTQGDFFEVMEVYPNSVSTQDNAWVDWTQPNRADKWWADWDNGIIFIWYAWLGYRLFNVRVNYRYGETDANGNPNPPPDIKLAVAYKVASILASGAEKWNLLPQGANNIVEAKAKIDWWDSQFEEIMARYTEWMAPH